MTATLPGLAAAGSILSGLAAAHPVAAAAGGLAIGIAAGAAYFLSLRFNTALYLQGRPGPAAGLQLLRLGLLALVLAGVSLCGALPLLAAAAGLLLARRQIVRRARRAEPQS